MTSGRRSRSVRVSTSFTSVAAGSGAPATRAAETRASSIVRAATARMRAAQRSATGSSERTSAPHSARRGRVFLELATTS